MSLSVTEQILLEALDLLAESKVYVSRGTSIGSLECSRRISDFFRKNGELHRQLRAKHDASPRQAS